MTKSLTLPRSQVLTFSSSHALTLRLEGGLFSPDLLEALAAADLPGQKPADFGLPSTRSLTAEIAAVFSDARALWQVFQNRLERLPEDDMATSQTRDLWAIPLLRLLGYDLRYNPRALEVDGQMYPISHMVVDGRGGEQESTSTSLPFSRSHALPLSPSHALPLSPSPALYLPLYEAKMLWHYDHRYGTYEGVSDRSSTQLPTPDERQHADPHFVVQPWYWVPAEEVQARLGDWQRGWLLGFRNVARSTDERTAIFGLLPISAVGNSLPVLLLSNISAPFVAGLVANFSTVPFDWAVRQKLAGVNMNFFYVEQLPILPPDAYTAEDLRFIVPRVLELTYTAWDLQPFAQDVWNEADDPLRAAILQQEHESKGAAEHENSPALTLSRSPSLPLSRSPSLPLSRSPSLPLSPFTWHEERRALLRAELDAYYARLYGLTRKQLRYILDPADLTERELADLLDPWEEVSDPLDPQGYAARVAASTFPGETFRVLKEKELRQYGEYRTRRLVLEAWERLKSSKTKSEAQ